VAQHVHQTAHDGQAHAGAGGEIALGVADLIEFLEDRRLMGGLDADTGIADDQIGPVNELPTRSSPMPLALACGANSA
jgi:hypothetical protein